MKQLLIATLMILMSFFTPDSWGETPPQTDADTIALSVGGMTRHYILYAPPNLAEGAPLLIAFHPSSSSGAKMRNMSGGVLESLARKYGFAVAYPNGYEGHFNDCRREATYHARTKNIDDIGYTRAIIDDVATRYKSDRSRIYALGYSNGGHMVLRLALQTPDMIAGIIAVSANLPVPENNDCKIADGRPVSVVLIEGTKDRINPYQGGEVTIFGMDSRGSVMSAQDSAQWFAKRYDLGKQNNVPAPMSVGSLTANWQDWGKDNVATKVRLITIEGGGHTIPQSGMDYPALLVGATFRSDVPLESAWNAITGSTPK
jgi:polyhydroxybutyrate depolymerase